MPKRLIYLDCAWEMPSICPKYVCIPNFLVKIIIWCPHEK